MISASQAKITAFHKKYDTLLLEIDKLICDAVDKGETRVIYNGKIPYEVWLKMNNLGYEVIGNFFLTKYTISWSD